MNSKRADAFLAAQSDGYMSQLGIDRGGIAQYWLQHTPEGQNSSLDVREAESLAASDAFLVEATRAIQRLVYGDAGDKALEVAPQPATASEADGIYGPMTHRRAVAYEQSLRPDPGTVSDDIPTAGPVGDDGYQAGDYLLIGGARVPLRDPEVILVTLDERAAVDLAELSAKRWGRPRGFGTWPSDVGRLIREESTRYARINAFWHWDVAWSAVGKDTDGDGFGDEGRGAVGILVSRKLSSGMGVDRPRRSDGKAIGYQWLDPAKHYGYHGGTAANRSAFFSGDLSSTVSVKYADRYEELCGLRPPVIRCSQGTGWDLTGKVYLGRYEAQLRTLLAVNQAVADYTGRRHRYLVTPAGVPLGRQVVGLHTREAYRGVVATHRHNPDTTKWDVRGLEHQIAVLLLLRPSLRALYPDVAHCFRLDDPEWGQRLDAARQAWSWPGLF